MTSVNLPATEQKLNSETFQRHRISASCMEFLPNYAIPSTNQASTVRNKHNKGSDAKTNIRATRQKQKSSRRRSRRIKRKANARTVGTHHKDFFNGARNLSLSLQNTKRKKEKERKIKRERKSEREETEKFAENARS